MVLAGEGETILGGALSKPQCRLVAPVAAFAFPDIFNEVRKILESVGHFPHGRPVFDGEKMGACNSLDTGGTPE